MKRSPDAQALLDRYRDALSPAASARERGLAELKRRVERGDRPRAAERAPEPRVRPWRARGVSAAIGGGLGVLGVVAWVVWGGGRSQPAPSPAAHAARVVVTSVAPATQRASDEPSPAPLPDAQDRVSDEATTVQHPSVQPIVTNAKGRHGRSASSERGHPALADDARTPPRRDPSAEPGARGVQPTAAAAVGAAGPRPVAPTMPVARAQHGELERELLLLRAAYAALRAGRPDLALTRLAEHAVQFPRGELAESREVAQIMALCQSGQTAAARAHAEQFLRRRPDSANAARVRSLCAQR